MKSENNMNRVQQDVISKEEQDKIVIENIDIVEKECRKFAKKYYNSGLSYEDFVSAANIGLIEGAKRYDPSKGKPRNYVRWWIKSKIYHTLYERKVIHTPWNKIDKIIKAQKEEKTSDLSFAIPQVLSLNMEARENENNGIDQIEYEAITSISGVGTDFNTKNDLKDHIEHVLNVSSLSSIEKNTIIHRFGLLGNEPKTFLEIASLNGYTAMGIKKAESRALNKLKKMDLIKELK